MHPREKLHQLEEEVRDLRSRVLDLELAYARKQPAPKRYVKVILDQSVERETTYLKPYTYEDQTLQGLAIGDRVVVPIGAYGTTKDATVISTDVKPTGSFAVKVVAGVL